MLLLEQVPTERIILGQKLSGTWNSELMLMTFRPQVNPEIRGGLIVEIGDRTIDLSVASKMSRMNKLLSETL